MNISFDSLESSTGRQRLLNRVVIALWVTVLLIIFWRVALFYPQRDNYVVYVGAGLKWINAQRLYSTTRGFVYSPLIAACFVPFTFLPGNIGAILWQFLNAAAFVGIVF
jgi:hypothetical protein